MTFEGPLIFIVMTWTTSGPGLPSFLAQVHLLGPIVDFGPLLSQVHLRLGSLLKSVGGRGRKPLPTYLTGLNIRIPTRGGGLFIRGLG